MECGDLSPLLTSRLVGSQQHGDSCGVTSPAVQSGDKSPHSIKRGTTFIGGIGEEGLVALALAGKLAQEGGGACDVVAVNIESHWPFEEFNPQNTIKSAGGQVTLAYGNDNTHYSQAASALADMGKKSGRQVELLPLDVSGGGNLLSELRMNYFDSHKKAQEARKKNLNYLTTDYTDYTDKYPKSKSPSVKSV